MSGGSWSRYTLCSELAGNGSQVMSNYCITVLQCMALQWVAGEGEGQSEGGPGRRQSEEEGGAGEREKCWLGELRRGPREVETVWRAWGGVVALCQTSSIMQKNEFRDNNTAAAQANNLIMCGSTHQSTGQGLKLRLPVIL
jgi:hypothetical protein